MPISCSPPQLQKHEYCSCGQFLDKLTNNCVLALLNFTLKSLNVKLEKENNFLHKVVDRFKETIDIFITWICKKFDMGAENNLIRDFERENNILLDAEKQIKHEEREKDLEVER